MKPDFILFTDASYKTDYKKKGVGIYAFLSLVNATEIIESKFDVIYGKSSTYAEAMAIEYGLRFIHSNIKSEENKSVIVISDSLSAVRLINRYIKSDYYGRQLMYFDKVTTSVFKRIYEMVDSSALDVYIVHVNSHLKEKDYPKVIKSLRSEFGYRVSKKVAKQIIHFNNQVDKIAHTNLVELINRSDKI